MDDAAAQLQADLDARRVRRLFADERGPASVPQAYALQRRLRAVREARGEKVVGFKIGYTSPSVRKAGLRTMGIDHSSGTRSSDPPARTSTTGASASRASWL
jgi:2-keto-4-pentenoate hydratase